MPTLHEYFAANRWKPVYQFGDRVYGKWQGVPFMGTVSSDLEVNNTIGPLVHVFFDLPITKDNITYDNAAMAHNHIIRKLLRINLDEEAAPIKPIKKKKK